MQRHSMPQPAALQIRGRPPGCWTLLCNRNAHIVQKHRAETTAPAVLQAESEARQAATAQLAEQRKDAAAAERQLRAYYEGRLRERNRELAAARMHVQVQLLVGRGAVEALIWWCACVGAGCCWDAPAGACFE